jgi:beta-phosphoglucomutase-like phosphatase (HAD superfamily)
MVLGIDIDSTLHPYWEQFERAARRRFGVEMPYAEQVTWEVPALRPEQFKVVIAETHAPEAILAAVPFPGAVETIRGWHEAGHQIHIVSHRHAGAREATAEWLERIGLPYDGLDCSEDKIVHAKRIGVELLIDDSPVNLAAALAAGIRGATLAHPWNRDVCEEEGLVCAEDWPALARALAPVLAGGAAAQRP